MVIYTLPPFRWHCVWCISDRSWYQTAWRCHWLSTVMCSISVMGDRTNSNWAQFPGRWIGCGSRVLLLVRSLDLIPVDCINWRHLKEFVYRNQWSGMEDLGKLHVAMAMIDLNIVHMQASIPWCVSACMVDTIHLTTALIVCTMYWTWAVSMWYALHVFPSLYYKVDCMYFMYSVIAFKSNIWVPPACFFVVIEPLSVCLWLSLYIATIFCASTAGQTIVQLEGTFWVCLSGDNF